MQMNDDRHLKLTKEARKAMTMRYRIFGRTGLRVSSLALGTGNFGTGWGYGSSREEAKVVFDGYRNAGGNFIDTADQYQFGQSETMVGEFIASDRDDMVVATKFSLGDRHAAGLQRTGNSRKAMVQSVEASLKRLGTDRIDLLWAHMPDAVTPIDEIMRGFDDLVRSGKILYAGLSDFPAWRVATGATLAELRGWAPLSALQLEYSLVERTSERELLPMAAAFGLGRTFRLPGLARGDWCHACRASWLGAAVGSAAGVQPRRAYVRARAAANGGGLWPWYCRLVAARRRAADR